MPTVTINIAGKGTQLQYATTNCTSLEAVAIVKIESKNRVFLTIWAIAS
ncbi:hypothetical protein [Undibacterium squillarum]|uniref:Uncharacterized protein n=1 Tax=Undibacterium squillarum TaxID=1131567 RepID=A0ABQ2XZD5_9BURK|nr:hypothetical protein [Undibacterium squillarum]GGX41871.1 hypothetical protein GCM10010946_20490 [Undibacterium squillarum]